MYEPGRHLARARAAARRARTTRPGRRSRARAAAGRGRRSRSSRARRSSRRRRPSSHARDAIASSDASTDDQRPGAASALTGTPAVVARSRADASDRGGDARRASRSQAQHQQRGPRVVEVVGELGRLRCRARGPTRSRTSRTRGWPRRSRLRSFDRRRRSCPPSSAVRTCVCGASGTCASAVGGGRSPARRRGRAGRRAWPSRSRRRALKRSSYGCPEPRAISVRLSALLASKPSMRAVASATVCAYGPSRASLARSIVTRPSTPSATTPTTITMTGRERAAAG